MLRDILVLHWGSVVAWLRAEVASVVLEQPERDYPYYGINAAEGQKQAALLLVDRQLVVSEIVSGQSTGSGMTSTIHDAKWTGYDRIRCSPWARVSTRTRHFARAWR